MKRIFNFILILVVLLLVSCQKTNISVEKKENKIEIVTEKAEQKPEEILTASIEIISAPTEIKKGESFNVTWRIDSNLEKRISHTAIHYDKVFNPSEFTFATTPEDAGYSLLTKEYAKGIYLIPNEFAAEIKVPEDYNTIYYRAHAIIDNNNYWTKDKKIKIIQPISQEKEVNISEIVVEADDNGLYPAQISIKKGDKVKLTFKVRKEGTYFNGLDFRGTFFNTKRVYPGTNASIEFTADKAFTYSSYWPSSNVKKADGRMLVTE